MSSINFLADKTLPDQEKKMTEQHSSDPSRQLRGGLTLSVEQVEQIQIHVDKLARAIPAKYMLVIETSGQLVCAYGERMIPDIAILGSLIAADLAASKEIASITGEYQNYQLIIREGEYTNLVISEIGKQMALMAAFTRDVPIGWARKLIQNASTEIDDLIKTPRVNIDQADNEVEEGDLPDLYNEALSQIWKE
jgi:hypothetical protein